jgi:hypothetical protein
MAVEMTGEPEIAAKVESAKQNKQKKISWIGTLRRAAIFCSPKLDAVIAILLAIELILG